MPNWNFIEQLAATLLVIWLIPATPICIGIVMFSLSLPLFLAVSLPLAAGIVAAVIFLFMARNSSTAHGSWVWAISGIGGSLMMILVIMSAFHLLLYLLLVIGAPASGAHPGENWFHLAWVTWPYVIGLFLFYAWPVAALFMLYKRARIDTPALGEPPALLRR